MKDDLWVSLGAKRVAAAASSGRFDKIDDREWYGFLNHLGKRGIPFGWSISEAWTDYLNGQPFDGDGDYVLPQSNPKFTGEDAQFLAWLAESMPSEYNTNDTFNDLYDIYEQGLSDNEDDDGYHTGSRRTATGDDGLQENCANCGIKVAKFDKTCKKCGYLFPSVPKIKTMQSEAADSDIRFKCYDCGARFKGMKRRCSKCGSYDIDIDDGRSASFSGAKSLGTIGRVTVAADASRFRSEIDQIARALGDAGSEFRSDDWYDTWGTAMQWAFSINDRISDLGGTTNDTYRPGSSGSDWESYQYQTLMESNISVSQLEQAESLLNNLLDKLQAAGLDY